jgi:hypothetical protein
MIYLIAHKVRGEPAFDIGSRFECPECHGIGCPECGDGQWWIIPTTGHRAYAYWHTELNIEVPPMPKGLRDHYATVNAVAVAKPKLSLNEIIACIGEP